MVNILLRVLKSFIEIYNSVYTFISKYLVSNTHAIFHVQFISSVVSNQFKTNQYAIYRNSFQKIHLFHNPSNILEIEREKWRTNQFIYGSNGAHMHIHIKPFRFILSNKTQNRNKEGSVKNKVKKVVAL